VPGPRTAIRELNSAIVPTFPDHSGLVDSLLVRDRVERGGPST
jgi:hypothetical protein